MGCIFIISAPSGAGKTSLVQGLIAQDSQLCKTISHTTRKKRPTEVSDESYHFVSEAEFNALKAEGGFLECAQVFGAQYGTSESAMLTPLQHGKDVILEIDWQGARQVAQRHPCVRIFILPPSLEALEHRLRHRGQDSPAVIAQRLEGAQHEMQHYCEYDYVVFNADFETALHELQAIIEAERCRTSRVVVLHGNRIQDLLAEGGRSTSE